MSIPQITSTVPAPPPVRTAPQTTTLTDTVRDLRERMNALQLSQSPPTSLAGRISEIKEEQPETAAAAAPLAPLPTSKREAGALLFKSVNNGDIDTIRRLLEEGMPIEALAEKATTPLLCACISNRVEVARFLLTECSPKANIEARMRSSTPDNKDNLDGITPLIFSCMLGSKSMVELLLENGARIEARTTQGSSSLIMASKSGHSQVVELLLDKGALIDNNNNHFKFTALHAAIELGQLEVVQLLCDRGANIEAEAIKNMTPLSVAIAGRHEAIVSFLLERGAIIQERHLTLADQLGATNIISLLLHQRKQAGGCILS